MLRKFLLGKFVNVKKVFIGRVKKINVRI